MDVITVIEAFPDQQSCCNRLSGASKVARCPPNAFTVVALILNVEMNMRITKSDAGTALTANPLSKSPITLFFIEPGYPYRNGS